MTETPLLRAIRAALVRDGRCIVWRNSTGYDAERRVRYGLGVGGADLVGLVRGSGRFLALEVKTPVGRLSPEQRAWLEAVRSRGGVAEVVRSVAEALAVVDAVVAAGLTTERPLR